MPVMRTRNGPCYIPFVAALLLGVSWPVLAGAEPSLECGGSSQVEIKRCLAQTEANVERALAVAFEIARRQAEELDGVTGRPQGVAALEKGQSAWIAYREAHCNYVGSTFGGGSGTGIGIMDCRIRLSRLRIEELITPK
jgi:uncharacterized protein YecT (DUF1311 family)